MNCNFETYFQDHAQREHNISLRRCLLCPQLLSNFGFTKHKEWHIQQAELNHEPVRQCDFCEELLNVPRKEHNRSCHVRLSYKKAVADSADAKWRRFDNQKSEREDLPFNGFSYKDLDNLNNPYDFYYSEAGKKYFEMVTNKKIKFHLGVEHR